MSVNLAANILIAEEHVFGLIPSIGRFMKS